MWALDNRTPYAAERNWVRDKGGRHLWVVAVKATFDVGENGRLRLADEQEPPALEPDYKGAPGASSLRADSDLIYVKPCTDVVADAHAHAPGGRPTERVSISLRVGSIYKELEVYGDRVYYQGPLGVATTAPAPFLSRPVDYESAYGGADYGDPDPARHRLFAANPIGKGFAVDSARLASQPAHAVEYRGGALQRGLPAGLGPIDPAWSPRRERAGTCDAAWVRNRKPLLPDDYDELYGSSAPEDQRARPFLRGGEPVELRGVTAAAPLRCELPKIYLSFTSFFGARHEEHRSRLVTVFLQPERMRIALVWQTTLFVAPRDSDYLDLTVIDEKSYLDEQ